MGSDTTSYQCFDCLHESRVHVVSMNEKLERSIRFYDVFESSLNFVVAGFLFQNCNDYSNQAFLEKLKKAEPM